MSKTVKTVKVTIEHNGEIQLYEGDSVMASVRTQVDKENSTMELIVTGPISYGHILQEIEHSIERALEIGEEFKIPKVARMRMISETIKDALNAMLPTSLRNESMDKELKELIVEHLKEVLQDLLDGTKSNKNKSTTTTH